MRKALKITLIAICTMAVLLGTTVAVTFIYRNDIIAAALGMLAQNHELEFREGNVSLTFNANISSATLLFDNLHVNNIIQESSEVSFSLDAASVYADVDLLKFLLKREVKIEHIVVVAGNWDIVYLNQKKKNAQKNTHDDVRQQLMQALRSVRLENNRIAILTNGERYTIDVKSMAAKLRSQGIQSDADVSGKIKVSWPKRKFAADMAIDGTLIFAKNMLNINNCKLEFDNISVKVNSNVQLASPKSISADITGKKIQAERLIAVAKKYGQRSTTADLRGKVTFAVSLKGALEGKQPWRLGVNGYVENMNLYTADKKHIKSDELKYNITSSNASRPDLYIAELSSECVKYLDFQIGGNARIANFRAPLVEADISGFGQLESLENPILERGWVECDLQLRARGWRYADIEKLRAQGSCKGLRAHIMGDIFAVDGDFSANKYSLKPNIHLTSRCMNGKFNGEIQGYLSAMMRDAGKPASLAVSGFADVERVDVDDFLSLGNGPKSGLTVSARLNGKAKSIKLFNNTYTNTSCTFDYSAQKIVVEALRTNAFGGTLNGDIKVFDIQNNNKKLSGDVYFNNIQIDKISYINDNFKLNPGTISGKCDGAISLNATFSEHGINTRTLRSTINATISNGRLLHLEALRPLGDYINRELLDDVRFSAMKNTINIDGERITIPQMEIRSTALNTIVAGTQWLNGDFDYHLTLYPGELLSGRKKNIENPIKNGKTQIFLHFTSKGGKQHIEIDRAEWRKEWQRTLRQEKEDFKGLFRAQQPASTQTQKEPQSPVRIGWDEDTATQHPPRVEPTVSSPKAVRPVEPKKSTEKKKEQKVEIEWEDE